MKRRLSQLAACVVTGFACLTAPAQTTFNLEDTGTFDIRVFTNSMGTANWTNDSSMIAFMGELDSTFNVTSAYNETSGDYIASLQLVAQIHLFDELPVSNVVGDVQGAVAALRDAPASSNGIYYVWGITNSAPLAWVPLLQTNGVPFTITEGDTRYLTFVFSYPVSSGNVTYRVFVGETRDTQYPSEEVTSLTTETGGLTGVSLLGIGGVQQVGSASGVVAPLSASIGFSVYATSQGVLLILDTEKEQGEGWIIVKAKINGVWVEVGRYWADGSGSNHYEFYATYPLVVGQPYEFKVIDEAGNVHTLSQPVEIKTIKMERVVMDASVIFVTFNSEVGRAYQVMVSDTLSSTNWIQSAVYFPKDGDEWGYGSTPFMAGGVSTTIKIPRGESPTNRAFFKIIKVD